MVQWKQQHEGSKCPFVLGHETWGARRGGRDTEGCWRGQLQGCCCCLGLLGGSCPELLSFPQSLQSDKEALQEGRGTAVKYRRTPDGYIQIGTAGWGGELPAGFGDTAQSLIFE